MTFVNEEVLDLICMSESFERPDKPLDSVIDLENFKIISSVHQRKGKGGRPAIFVNTNKYEVENLTNTSVSIPWGVEIVWAALTPKNVTNSSEVQKIIVASIYSKPNSKKKTILLDHIAQVYNLFCTKYKKGLHWLLCGDTNDLRLDPILALSPNLKQCVQNFTRQNPPRILDPIITTMSKYYQIPKVVPPLDPDPEKRGKPSDHMMVIFTPINNIENKCVKRSKEIIFRPINTEGVNKMRTWLISENWHQVLKQPCANLKADISQNILVSKFNEYFPEKRKAITSKTPEINEV